MPTTYVLTAADKERLLAPILAAEKRHLQRLVEDHGVAGTARLLQVDRATIGSLLAGVANPGSIATYRLRCSADEAAEVAKNRKKKAANPDQGLAADTLWRQVCLYVQQRKIATMKIH